MWTLTLWVFFLLQQISSSSWSTSPSCPIAAEFVLFLLNLEILASAEPTGEKGGRRREDRAASRIYFLSTSTNDCSGWAGDLCLSHWEADRNMKQLNLFSVCCCLNTKICTRSTFVWITRDAPLKTKTDIRFLVIMIYPSEPLKPHKILTRN